MDPITSAASTTPGLTSASVAATGRVSTPGTGTPAASSSSTTASPVDQVQISLKGTLTSKYVQEVRAVAPLDQQAITQLKAAIAKGNYPPPSLIEGLINLVGATIPSADAAADPTAASTSDAS